MMQTDMHPYEISFCKAVIDLQQRFTDEAWNQAKHRFPGWLPKLQDKHQQLAKAWQQDDMQVFREALKGWYLEIRRALGENKQGRGTQNDYFYNLRQSSSARTRQINNNQRPHSSL